jgi:hypothetical protein
MLKITKAFEAGVIADYEQRSDITALHSMI